MATPEADLQKEESNLGVQADQTQVTGLQGAIQNTTNILNQVAPSVMGRTANSLVTSAQADKQISNEQAPIQTNLTNDNNAYTAANTNYTNALGQAETMATADQTAQTNEQSYLQNIYNNLYTKEQNTDASNAAAAAAAEQAREFNASLAAQQASAAATSKASTAAISPSLATTSGSQSAMTGLTQKAPGSFEFTSNGSPIKGYVWAQQNNVDPLTLLSYLSSKGDSGAKNTLAEIQKAGGITQQVMAENGGFF
jgi:hypothetical protein